jgi:hypothetical protein
MKRRLLATAVLLAVLATGILIGILITEWRSQAPVSQAPVKAYCLVHIARHPPSILLDRKTDKEEFDTYRRLQQALVKNRVVLNKALSEKKVRELAIIQEQIDPVAWLEKHVNTDFDIAPEIMRISISGTNPTESTLLLDAIREAYLTEAVEKAHKNRLKRLEDLKDLYVKYDLGLKRKRQDLRAVVEDLGSGDTKYLALKLEFALKALHAVQMELLDIQSQLRKAKVEAQFLTGDAKAASENRIDFLTKLQEVVDKEAETLSRHNMATARRTTDMEWLKDEIAMLDETVKRISRHIQDLQVEIQAPRRVNLFEDTVVVQ